MKTLLLIFILTGFYICCYSQNLSQNTIPSKVKNKYEKLYPKATRSQWIKEKKNYEVNFKIEQTRISVLIDSIGNLIETSISTLALPNEITEYIDRSYPGEKIARSEKVIKTRGKIYYKVRIDGDELLFDENGQ